jgi:hypothetical protein
MRQSGNQSWANETKGKDSSEFIAFAEILDTFSKFFDNIYASNDHAQNDMVIGHKYSSVLYPVVSRVNLNQKLAGIRVRAV